MADLRRAFGGPSPGGVCHFFAGEQELDLAWALEILNRELGLERLLLEGCRPIGADHLDDTGEHRDVGGRRGLAPLSAPKQLVRSGGRR
jgi:hypothetical protein